MHFRLWLITFLPANKILLTYKIIHMRLHHNSIHQIKKNCDRTWYLSAQFSNNFISLFSWMNLITLKLLLHKLTFIIWNHVLAKKIMRLISFWSIIKKFWKGTKLQFFTNNAAMLLVYLLLLSYLVWHLIRSTWLEAKANHASNYSHLQKLRFC